MRTEKIQIVVITDYIEYDKCEIACGFYTLEEAQRYIDDGDEYDKECSRIAYADDELNELSLSIDDVKKLADRIGSSDSWNSEDLKAICEYAGLSEEWENANGENFETVVYKAAKILGVSI